MRTTPRRALPGATSAALAALLAVVLTGCGASEPVDVEPTAAAGAEGRTQYPLVLENCGQQVTVEAPPQRAVSLDQGSTEVLLSLGLEERVVGTASWTDPVLEPLAAANEQVPRLADNAPSYEVLVGAEPDFVSASFGRHFAQGGVVTRERLAETGTPSYLSPTDCDAGTSINAGGVRSRPVTADDVYREVRELAEVFDVSSRGEALVAQLQQRAAAATDGVDLGGRTVAFWFADTTAPYVAGGPGAPGFLAQQTGMVNAFGDLPQDWSAVGWESVVAADPDVLVLGDLQRDRFPGDRLDAKEAFLAGDPLTQGMDVVQHQRYVVLHGAEMNPSIRFVDGLEKIRAWYDANRDQL